MEAPRRRMNAGDWGLLVALSVLWGGSFFFNQVAVAELPALTVSAARVALAAATLVAIAALAGASLPRGRGVIVAFLGMGLLNNALPFTLIVWGQAQIGSGAAAILNASTPLFTVLLAHGLTADERLTPGRLAGVVVGFAGVAAMLGGGIGGGIGGGVGGGAWAAQAACLAGALSYALASVWGRRFRRLEVAPLATAAGQLVASSLMLAPLALLVDRPWTLPAPSAAALASLAGVALLSTALAYVLYFRLLARAGASNLMLVTLLIPVTAVALGAAVLGEALTARHLAGMALIALGLAAIDGRPLALLRGRAA
jgi:drug/metabolite transporter (DMT)-like permease